MTDDMSQSHMSLRVEVNLEDSTKIINFDEIIRFHGIEGISIPFRYEILLVSQEEAVEIQKLVGSSADLILRSPHGTREIHGIIGQVDYLGEDERIACYRLLLLPHLWLLTHRYQSRIFQNLSVPEIVEQVITTAGILGGKFVFDQILVDKYQKREYCVQYRETDFNFIARLMEEEGIYYFFEHIQDQCRMVIGDANIYFRTHEPPSPLHFCPPSGMTDAKEHVFRFTASQEVRPDQVILRDYYYMNPRLDLECTSHLNRNSKLEISDYPGKYTQQRDGHRYARVRVEEMKCRRTRFEGSSNSPNVIPGRVLSLMKHPQRGYDGDYLITRCETCGWQRASRGFDPKLGQVSSFNAAPNSAIPQDANPNARFSTTESMTISDAPQHSRMLPLTGYQQLGLWSQHAGQVATDPIVVAHALALDPLGSLMNKVEPYIGNGHANPSHAVIYECHFECIPSDVLFRPPRITPKPVMRGTQTAMVVGPPGQEIYTDRLGRVKVKFPWDRSKTTNHNSSCWIRTSQPWAGKGWGAIQIPRIGQEVIVDFIEGDPDRPIIIGRVYNAESMPPVSSAGRDPAKNEVNPRDMIEAAMQMTLRSNSLGGSGGHNEITMDDSGNAEKLFIRAQKDEVHNVLNDRKLTVGNNEHHEVGNDETFIIGVNETRQVGKNQQIHVGQNILIDAGTSITLKCGAGTIHMNQAGFITISGTVISIEGKVNCNMTALVTNVTGKVLLTNTGAVNLIIGGLCRTQAGLLASINSAGQTEMVAGSDAVIQGENVKLN